ncbi:MAG: VCBS repeat-containing protein, partial [Gammaproteobacteria bacterium]|nr:VCBS repeat-containing protein [Gammaproteobacteria bacterium]
MPRFSVLLLGGLLAGCSPAPDATDLRESAQTTGLWFVHDAGRSGKLLLPEITGSGVGLIDYDSDGDLDVFFAQGAAPGTRGEGNRLFRNELVPTGELGFVDVSATAGALGDGFAMGVSTADIDNDGDTDLFVSGVGRDYLLRNDDSTFVDITAMAGVDDPRWNGSASFADIDNDGDLDLFVTAYVDGWSDQARGCNNQTGAEDYCSPGNFEPTTDRLYRNDGDGRFRDITAVSGIDAAAGAGLGVVAGDFNGDDRVDFYVANDQTDNHMWLQTETGRFTEQALMRGSAYNADGRAEASMGVTVADIDGNGADDLFMTHLNNESNTLYLNDGRGAFREVTDRFGLGSTSLPYTGWGANWVDLDHDTDLDLYIVNVSVMTSATQGET